MNEVRSVESLDDRRNRRFSAMVEFSGALSDNGNYDSLHGASPKPFFEGRTTNGPVAGELLARSLGLSVQPSMHLVGPVKGSNFAVRDAMAAGDRPGDLAGQVSAYLDSVDGAADPNALYFVFNGGNDVIQAVMTQDNAESVQLLMDAIDGLERALRRLVEAGAKHVMAPDFIDVSVLPLIRMQGDPARAQLLSEIYNRCFRRMLLALEQKLQIRFLRWSFDAFFRRLLSDGAQFGFANTTEPLAPLLEAGGRDEGSHVFLTEVFPTTKVHQLMADSIREAISSREARE
ncbi:SGNH/GDSL hydrolase family protein [Salipiger sp. P9]|uniref:SGNH/GDSL hydrolase family protein n=1 Tax=Salipiger pentaromativorans TaxID=2943193 RepID=UPI00215751C2|nr:SGNH/GDSL hydrolase family protein [Salipiger pentaromativorans]MCR8547595.1 SGNH/GDSL hydrolase family protein [Salipiger pentaromativorans]